MGEEMQKIAIGIGWYIQKWPWSSLIVKRSKGISAKFTLRENWIRVQS